jgi:hypothetical protein
MFQPDPSHWPMGFLHTMLPPHFLGGVAPSRHDVALAAYLEKQVAQRLATSAGQLNLKVTMRLWGKMAHRLTGTVWHTQLGRLSW